MTPEELEAEREVEQKKIDEAVPLTEEEMAEKEMLVTQGFENWSRRDFQQFVRALETHGWYVTENGSTRCMLIFFKDGRLPAPCQRDRGQDTF